MIQLLLALIFALCFAPAGAQSFGSASTGGTAQNPFLVQPGAARLVAGDAGKLELIIVVPPGHHVYQDMVSVKTLDPAGLRLGTPSLPEGFARPDPANPSQTRVVYEYDVIIEVAVTGAAAGEYAPAFEVAYQGCREGLCFMPARDTLSVPVTVAPASQGAHTAPAYESSTAFVQSTGGAADAAEVPPDPVHVSAGTAEPGMVVVNVRVDEPWHVNRDFMLLVFPQGDPRAEDEAWGFGDYLLPEGERFVDPATGFERTDLDGEFVMKAPLKAPPGTHTLNLEVGFQACKASLCLIPDYKPVTVTVEVAGAAPAPATAGAAPAPATAVPDLPGGDLLSNARASGVGALILLVLLAGVGVSFTPCVLPMVPITIGIIGASSSNSRARAVALAATYVAGMALVYSVLGVAAGLTGMMFGSWLQSPWVVGAIGLFFFLMGVAMFGFFDLGMPSSIQTRLNQYGGAGFGGAFVVGMVGALVAGPCSGPVLLSIITLIGQKGELGLGAVLMLVFSLGMGLIFIAAGAFSSTLLRPGPWMDTVKKSFGLVMWAGALYFVAPQLSDTVTALIAAAMLLSTAVYAWPNPDMGEGFWVERTRRLYSITGGIVGGYLLLGVLLSQGFILPPMNLAAGGGQGASASDAAVVWSSDESGSLARASAEGRITVIDFTADWCAACKELEHFTYTDPRVIEASNQMVPVMIDMTRDDDPAVQALKVKYNIMGLPTVKFLLPDGRPLEHLTVTGFVDADEFLERMKAAEAARG